MWGLGLRLWHSFQKWERSLRNAAGIALVIMVLALVAAILGPLELRAPALVGIFGSLIALQILVMWSLCGMRTVQSLAWRAFRHGDFERCRQLLEEESDKGKASRSSLVLLAFTYKQLGMLEESEALARRLIGADASYIPAWRALGQAMLVQSKWDEAAQALERASETQADSRVELGLARLLVGKEEAAAEAMREALAAMGCSVSHAWLARKILSRANDERREDGDYWRDEAARFSHTRYGVALAEIIDERVTDQALP